MKQLTLDETWEQCLAMWKWISRQCKDKNWQWCRSNVCRLKEQWLDDNGFSNKPLDRECFLCDYDELRQSMHTEGCLYCPARKIDPAFYCTLQKYNYKKHPREFYAELKRLNKIRLS